MDYFVSAAWTQERDRMLNHVAHRSLMGDAINVHMLRELNDRFDQQVREADAYVRMNLAVPDAMHVPPAPAEMGPPLVPMPYVPPAASMSPAASLSGTESTFSFLMDPPVTPHNILEQAGGSSNSLVWPIDPSKAEDLVGKSAELLRSCTPAQRPYLRAVVGVCKGRNLGGMARTHNITRGKLCTLCSTLNTRGLSRLMDDIKSKY